MKQRIKKLLICKQQEIKIKYHCSKPEHRAFSAVNSSFKSDYIYIYIYIYNYHIFNNKIALYLCCFCVDDKYLVPHPLEPHKISKVRFVSEDKDMFQKDLVIYFSFIIPKIVLEPVEGTFFGERGKSQAEQGMK